MWPIFLRQRSQSPAPECIEQSVGLGQRRVISGFSMFPVDEFLTADYADYADSRETAENPSAASAPSAVKIRSAPARKIKLVVFCELPAGDLPRSPTISVPFPSEPSMPDFHPPQTARNLIFRPPTPPWKWHLVRGIEFENQPQIVSAPCPPCRSPVFSVSHALNASGLNHSG